MRSCLRTLVALWAALLFGAPCAYGQKPEPRVAQAKVAGLYIGSTMVFQPNPFGGVGSGTWVQGTKWYLLAADGRAHMGFKLPQAPGGDIRRFDFDAAKREAPQHAGTYDVQGNRVTIKLGLETVVGEINSAGELLIRGTPYRPSKVK